MQKIDALQILSVQDHGVANQERIVIYARQMCDLSEYCLILALPTPDGGLIPVKDHMLWFGQGWVAAGDCVSVFTGSGSTTIHTLDSNPVPGAVPARLINMHWGKQHTIFQNRALTPMLIRVAGTATLAPEAPAFQGTTNNSHFPWIR